MFEFLPRIAKNDDVEIFHLEILTDLLFRILLSVLYANFRVPGKLRFSYGIILY